ncbi:MAG: hypothetical protein R3304_11210, partial [Longimicrobiales bacterium]|nr:hypothetical protein [Longimicrobiales bacterium]
VAWMAVPSDFHFLAQMLMGMVLGAVSTLPLVALFSWLAGGFEILVLSMQAGMLAGMTGAMTGSASPGGAAFEGLLVGLIVQLLLHALDRTLGGEVARG